MRRIIIIDQNSSSPSLFLFSPRFCCLILPLLQGGDLLEWLCIRMQYQSHLFCNIPQYPPAFLKYPRLRLQAWREAGEVEKLDCRLSAMDFLLKQDAFSTHGRNKRSLIHLLLSSGCLVAAPFKAAHKSHITPIRPITTSA